MSKNESQTVLISGAGPCGLVTALALAQNGISVRVVDRISKFQVGQRGAALSPRTLEHYKLLGVLEDIQKASPIMHSLILYDEDGVTHKREMPMFPVEDNTPANPYGNVLILGQDRHEAILRQHLAKYNVHVELSTELISFEQTEDHISATLSKTVDGKQVEETAEFKWLVGADGASSMVRKTLGLSFLGESRQAENFVIGDIYIKDLEKKLNRKIWHVWGDASKKMASLRPYEIPNDDRCYYLGGGVEADPDLMVSSREEFIKSFYEISGRTDIDFGELIYLRPYRPNVRMVDKFGYGRVYVAGDASHVHSPTGAQGMNTGVQDCVSHPNDFQLNSLLTPSGVELGVEVGPGRERPRFKGTSRLLHSLSAYPVVASMLDKTTALLNKTFARTPDNFDGWKRGYELRQFGVNYRGSPVIVDETQTDCSEEVDPYRSGNDGTVRGGDRAPDAPGLISLGQPADKYSSTLFDVFGPTHHTLLHFSDDKEKQTAILDSVKQYPAHILKRVVVLPENTEVKSSDLPAELVFKDKDGYAYQNYVVKSRDLDTIVVRPDGVIGALVNGCSWSEGLL
ncbi:FAD binding domain-containing protein [Desarmillaria tabescens]|uniref:FAD binding domain-containing protein n=1 Tax=Armillaria tabescens TaxID=1929756 RepID=A0AA39TR38_ARMTA|nr:FAD binding domain-containing protein [Desarmillaria tabescens]KAK0463588.1 FAD binding domain-containing protein [Desarmillaria tabescens]